MPSLSFAMLPPGRHAKLTALMAASARGRTEVVRVLLSRSHKSFIVIVRSVRSTLCFWVRKGLDTVISNWFHLVSIRSFHYFIPFVCLSKSFAFPTIAWHQESWHRCQRCPGLDCFWASASWDIPDSLPTGPPRLWCMQFMDRGSTFASCCWRTKQNSSTCRAQGTIFMEIAWHVSSFFSSWADEWKF